MSRLADALRMALRTAAADRRAARADAPPAERRCEPSQRGQGMVEFAMVAIFLILLAGATAQLGLMYLVHLALRDASQEGASYASVDPTNTAQIELRVRQALSGTIDPASVSVTVSETNPGMFCASIDPVSLHSNGIRVEASYDLPIIVPFLGALVGGDTLTLRGFADDTILTPPC